jgi:hypothetical protein
MPMKVALRQPRTGNLKLVGTGWSWPIFVGAAFLGLPLFFRGLALWGTAMVFLWTMQIAVPVLAVADTDGAAVADIDFLAWGLRLLVAGLCLYLGIRGNALSARHFVACGYELAEPDSAEARAAARRWGL